MKRLTLLIVLSTCFFLGCAPTTAPTAALAARDQHVRGNRNSMIYHWRGCPNYDDIAPKNRVDFNSPAAAEAAGYRPARNCDTPAPR